MSTQLNSRSATARYPAELQADPFRRHQALTFGLGVAKKTVERNWQVAVPMYYFGHAPGQDPISLLLPLCLLEPGKADMALVVGPYGLQYKAFTVLSLDQAYRSARLIAKPTAERLGNGGVIHTDQPVVTSAGWRKVSVGPRDRTGSVSLREHRVTRPTTRRRPRQTRIEWFSCLHAAIRINAAETVDASRLMSTSGSAFQNLRTGIRRFSVPYFIPSMGATVGDGQRLKPLVASL
jgi:hypothetical protein